MYRKETELFRFALVLLLVASVTACAKDDKVIATPGIHYQPLGKKVHPNCAVEGYRTRTVKITCPNRTLKIWLEGNQVKYDQDFPIKIAQKTNTSWSVQLQKQSHITIVAISSTEDRITAVSPADQPVTLEIGGLTKIWVPYFTTKT